MDNLTLMAAVSPVYQPITLNKQVHGHTRRSRI